MLVVGAGPAGSACAQMLARAGRRVCLVDQQAFTRAADDIFIASAAIFLVLIASVWLTRRPPRLAAPVDAGGAH